MSYLSLLLAVLRGFVRSRTALLLENAALRQQLIVLRRSVKRPKATRCDRAFWLVLSRAASGWSAWLHAFSPETILRWHRAGWRALWRHKSRHKVGRPSIPWDLYSLIRRLSRENPTWGAHRITDELALLGWQVGKSTVGRYMVRVRPRSGQGWKVFLKNHMNVTAACDLFTVPTVAFRKLFVLVILSHDRRLIRHVAVTDNPTARWTAYQLICAFPKERPKYLIHDRQRCFTSEIFRSYLEALEIEDKKTAPRQAWMNGYCERVIGTLRRECTDHLLVFSERHLQRLLAEYVAYYNSTRTHMSLERNAPIPRAPAVRPAAELRAFPVLGGLHHRYEAAA